MRGEEGRGCPGAVLGLFWAIPAQGVEERSKIAQFSVIQQSFNSNSTVIQRHSTWMGAGLGLATGAQCNWSWGAFGSSVHLQAPNPAQHRTTLNDVELLLNYC